MAMHSRQHQLEGTTRGAAVTRRGAGWGGRDSQAPERPDGSRAGLRSRAIRVRATRSSSRWTASWWRQRRNPLTSMNNLAEVLNRQGKYEEAKEMHRQALRLKETVLGKEYPSTLTGMLASSSCKAQS